MESVESDYEQAQSDLRLAFKRISDLQAVIEDDIDTDDDDEDSDVYLRYVKLLVDPHVRHLK